MSNISTWCILIAALMPIACAGIAKWGTFSKPASEGGYDNSHPREWLARQNGWRLRANAAQANCFEALPFFIGALLWAQQIGVPQNRVDLLAVSFILLRCAYVAFYLLDRAGLRSLVWIAALAVNVAVLFSGA
ncbi:MAG: MAPEG family protein [Burkholderiaceae bacterium]|nr:MAPEG family protein [Burkholderiaceae bacterium]